MYLHLEFPVSEPTEDKFNYVHTGGSRAVDSEGETSKTVGCLHK